MRRARVLLVGLFAVLTGALLFAGPASAHATLVTSSPADGARLKAIPKTVSLTFDENVGLGAVGYVHVTSQTGARVDARAAYHPNGNGTVVSDDLKSGLPDGTYTVSWRVVSADSHPVAGTTRFVVGNGPLLAATGGGGSTVNHVTSVVFDVVRWIGYAGLALLGGAWLALTVWPNGRTDTRARQLIASGWLASVVAAIGGLLIQGPYTAGSGLSKLVDTSYIDDTLHTNFGHMVSARLVLLGLLAPLLGIAFDNSRYHDAEFDDAETADAETDEEVVAEPATRSRLEWAIWPLGVGLAVTYANSGHAETTNPQWLSVTFDALHVLGMMAWLGGLVMLLAAVLPWRDEDELSYVLPVFSRVAFVSVVVLAGTGTYAAWRGVGAWHAVFNTTYGWLVNAKILLFLGILAVANLSRIAVRHFSAARTERLRRSVLVEVVVGVAVLAFTSVLVSEPRGLEALAADYQQPVSATASLGGGQTITVGLDRGVHGIVSATIEVSSPVQSVQASAEQTNAEIGPIPLTLVTAGRTLYSAANINLPVSGTWEFDLVVATSATHAVTADVMITLH